MTIFASCEEILKEKECLFPQNSALDISEPSSWTLASLLVLFDTGGNDPDDPPTRQQQVPVP